MEAGPNVPADVQADLDGVDIIYFPSSNTPASTFIHGFPFEYSSFSDFVSVCVCTGFLPAADGAADWLVAVIGWVPLRRRRLLQSSRQLHRQQDPKLFEIFAVR